MHVGQHPVARPGAGDPGERRVEMGVGRVRLAAEGIDDPGVEPGEVGPGRRRGCRSVRQVGEVVDAEAERVDAPVPDPEWLERDRAARALDDEGAVDRGEVEDRRIEAACRLDEDVGEAREQQLRGLGVGPDRQAGAAVLDHGPQVVDAVQVVGMRVGVDDAVEEADAGREELRAQVGRGVDQHAGDAVAGVRSTRSEQRLRRLRGFAGSQSPQSPPMRGTPADEPQPRTVARSRGAHAAALANRRSKFAEVRRGELGRVQPEMPGDDRGRCRRCRRARCACRGAAAGAR